MENKTKLLPIGTKVFDARYGWGQIYRIEENDLYTYEVTFEKTEINATYTKKGLYDNNHKLPSLSLTEYDFVNGGFTPITDFNKPKIGDWGYFWDNENTKFAIFGQLRNSEVLYQFHIDGGGYKNFSKEIPEHLK